MSLRARVALNALFTALVAWLYGGDAFDAFRARTAEVSAYLEPPDPLFPLLTLGVTGLAALATAWGMWARRDQSWRGYRLLPIVAVVMFFFDLFVLGGAKPVLGAHDRTALTIRSFADQASGATVKGLVPTDARQLEAMLPAFGPPPFLQRGQPLSRWTVAVREGCSGPVNERNSEPVGTLFYCVAADGKSAWVSAVGLPVGTFFGPPTVFSRAGTPVTAVAMAPPPDEDPPAAENPDFEGQNPLETIDSGR